MGHKVAKTRYPLSAMMTVGVETLERFHLGSEGRMHAAVEEMQPFADLLVSGHAPSRKGDVRLNIAATDGDFREESIQEIVAYIDAVRQFPRLKQVNIHFAPRLWLEEKQIRGREGDYGLLVDAIRRIAGFAEDRGIEIVCENHARYWTGVADDVTGDQVDWESQDSYFGSSPEEWMAIREDVDRPNVFLCLDLSHACTYAHTFASEQRASALMSFLAKPHLIRHVHWSDNYLYDLRGRKDSHALLGHGTLTAEFHRAVRELDATILVENFPTAEELEEELRFIDEL